MELEILISLIQILKTKLVHNAKLLGMRLHSLTRFNQENIYHRHVGGNKLSEVDLVKSENIPNQKLFFDLVALKRFLNFADGDGGSNENLLEGWVPSGEPYTTNLFWLSIS